MFEKDSYKPSRFTVIGAGSTKFKTDFSAQEESVVKNDVFLLLGCI